MRPWPFNNRTNLTYRPTMLDIEGDLNRPIQDISECTNPWTIFLEVLPPDSGLSTLPTFDRECDVLLFFKMYDPKTKKIYYCGHHYMPVSSKVCEYFI